MFSASNYSVWRLSCWSNTARKERCFLFWVCEYLALQSVLRQLWGLSLHCIIIKIFCIQEFLQHFRNIKTVFFTHNSLDIIYILTTILQYFSYSYDLLSSVYLGIPNCNSTPLHTSSGSLPVAVKSTTLSQQAQSLHCHDICWASFSRLY